MRLQGKAGKDGDTHPGGDQRFMVLQGAESETLFDIDGGRRVEVGRRHRPAGSVSGVAPPDDIHRVANTGESVAITLHVYGADLSHGTSVRRTYELPANGQTRL